MKRFLRFLFKVFTLNGRLLPAKKLKQLSEKNNNELVFSKNTKMDVEQIKNALGGLTNFELVKHTINTIALEIKNVSEVNQEQLKKLGVKGLMFSDQKLKMVIGDDAKIIFDKLQELKAN